MLQALKCTFHHLGVACRNLDQEFEVWKALGYEAEGPDFEDPVQRVRGRFLTGPGPRLELLVALTPDSPVEAMVRRGIKFYHQAFETSAFDEAVAALKQANYKLATGPVPAVAFEERRIAFFFLPQLNLIELIEGRQIR